MVELEGSIRRVMEQIDQKVAELERNSEDIRLVAVSKTQPAEVINAALRAGIDYFGENKVQEAEEKLPLITAPYEGFHFVGHLQSNKVRALLKLEPDLIHSVDSAHIAREISRILEGTDRVQEILLQVNTSGEMSKFGVQPFLVPEAAIEMAELPNVRVMGLMTIGRLSENVEDCRQDFRLLKQLFDNLSKLNVPKLDMKWLSMGMSNDFEIALEEGANLLRIGSAIFGERNYTN